MYMEDELYTVISQTYPEPYSLARGNTFYDNLYEYVSYFTDYWSICRIAAFQLKFGGNTKIGHVSIATKSALT